MPKQPFEFNIAGGEYKSLSPNVNNQECVNFYVNADQEGGKTSSLYPTPGCKEWLNTSGGGEIRALAVIKDDTLCYVESSKVFITDKDKNITIITNNLTTTTGQVIILSDFINYFSLLDFSANKLYVVDFITNTLIEVILPSGVTPSSLTYIDGMWIILNKGTDYFYMSVIDDPYTYTALRFKAAEYKGDKLIALIADHSELVAFGSETIQFFFNNGNPNTVFSSISGSQQEVGIAGESAVTAINNTIYWLDNQGFPRYRNQYTPVFLPSSQIAFQMSKLNTINDCIVSSHLYQGHTFIVFTFPTENKTFVFDVATNLWHRRSSFPYGTDGRWRKNCYAFFDRKHLIGDYDNGKIYELDFEIFTEDGNILTAMRTCPAISSQRNYINHNSLEVLIQSGVGMVKGQGDDPVIMLQYSDDFGRTWSSELWRNMGKIGEFDIRVIWNRLGRSKDRLYRIQITDPINRILISGFLNGSY